METEWEPFSNAYCIHLLPSNPGNKIIHYATEPSPIVTTCQIDTCIPVAIEMNLIIPRLVDSSLSFAVTSICAAIHIMHTLKRQGLLEVGRNTVQQLC